MTLYKTSITIWSEYDTAELELTDLAHRAETGDAYCSRKTSALVAEPEKDPDWDGTDFFDVEVWKAMRVCVPAPTTIFVEKRIVATSRANAGHGCRTYARPGASSGA